MNRIPAFAGMTGVDGVSQSSIYNPKAELGLRTTAARSIRPPS